MHNFFKIPYKRVLIEICLAIILVPLICYNNIYYPKKQILDTNYKYEEIYFRSLDNTKLNARYIPPKENMPTILFSHGNWGNISWFFDTMIPFAEKGYGIFIYDYRGFGKSKGFPYENGLYKDLRASIKYLNEEKHTPNKNIVLWGLSIGGGVVSKIAAEENFKAVIMQSTFTNIEDMAVHQISKVTGNKYLSRLPKIVPCLQKFDNYSRIDKINPPFLLIHSKGDTQIPYEQAVKNSKKAKYAKFVLVNDDDHTEYTNSLPVILEFLSL